MIKIKDNLKKMQNNFLEWKIGINYESEPVHSSQDDILRPRIEAAEEEIRLDEERQFRLLQFGMVYKFKRSLPYCSNGGGNNAKGNNNSQNSQQRLANSNNRLNTNNNSKQIQKVSSS